jgi:hypothetical protein
MSFNAIEIHSHPHMPMSENMATPVRPGMRDIYAPSSALLPSKVVLEPNL